jgi:hypothetical protein
LVGRSDQQLQWSVGSEHLFLVNVYKDGYCRSQVWSKRFVLVFCMGVDAQANVVFFFVLPTLAHICPVVQGSVQFSYRYGISLLAAMGLVFS